MDTGQASKQRPLGFYERAGYSIIRSTLTKERIIFFPVNTWATMEDTLTKNLSTGSAVILRIMGDAYGRTFGRRLKESRYDLANGREFIRSLASAAGWGDVTIEAGEENSFWFTIRECAFCTEAEKRGSPSCHFLAGIALGIGRELYGKEPKATETWCMRAGAPACVIEMSL